MLGWVHLLFVLAFGLLNLCYVFGWFVMLLASVPFLIEIVFKSPSLFVGHVCSVYLKAGHAAVDA